MVRWAQKYRSDFFFCHRRRTMSLVKRKYLQLATNQQKQQPIYLLRGTFPGSPPLWRICILFAVILLYSSAFASKHCKKRTKLKKRTMETITSLKRSPSRSIILIAYRSQVTLTRFLFLRRQRIHGPVFCTWQRVPFLNYFFCGRFQATDDEISVSAPNAIPK